MIGKIDLEGLDKYRAFLSTYSGEVLGITNICLQKANAMQEQWQDSHVDEVINELLGLKTCIDKFSENCDHYCNIMQEMIDKYKLYLTGHFTG